MMFALFAGVFVAALPIWGPRAPAVQVSVAKPAPLPVLSLIVDPAPPLPRRKPVVRKTAPSKHAIRRDRKPSGFVWPKPFDLPEVSGG
jgi:hypothetical protein